MAQSTTTRPPLRVATSTTQLVTSSSATTTTHAPPILLTSRFTVRQDVLSSVRLTSSGGQVTVRSSTRSNPTVPLAGEDRPERHTTSLLPVSDGDKSSSTIGVAVGVTVIGVIILAVIIALVYLIIKRRQAKRREKGIVKIENPQYKLPPEIEERSLTLEKATLSVAPTVKFTANNNAALLDASHTANSRKRKDAPLPPVQSDVQGKRTAPAPPSNFALELYEKDSPAVSTEELTAIHNTNALVSPTSDDDVNIRLSPNASHLQPLIAADSADNRKRKSPKSSVTSTSSSPKRPLSGGPAVPESDFQRPISGEDDDSIGGEELATENQRTALLGNNAASTLSLDSYDRSLNPFFLS